MNLGGILIVFGIVIISVVLHEMAHGYMAYLLGDTTAKESGRLSLNPLKHIDPWMSIVVPLLLYLSGGVIFGGAKPVPINTRNLKGGAWGMALVGLAGPLVNLILAFGGFLVGYFSGAIFTNSVFGLVCLEVVMINLGFFVFNMIPIPPLDGSRVLYAIAPDGVRRLMARMEQGVGILLVLVLVLIFGTALSGVISKIINWIVGVFFFIVGA